MWQSYFLPSTDYNRNLDDINTELQNNLFLECSRAFYNNSNDVRYVNWNVKSTSSCERDQHQLPFAYGNIYRLEKHAGGSGMPCSTMRSSSNAPKKNSYTVEELLKKDDMPEYSKMENLFFSMPPCGLLIDQSCTCNLKFISETTWNGSFYNTICECGIFLNRFCETIQVGILPLYKKPHNAGSFTTI